MTVSVRPMMGIVAIVAVAALIVLLASSVTGPPIAHAGDVDCADFSTQKKAQKYFKQNNPRSDPFYLDADNDRIACEDNPCPCARKWHRQHGRTLGRLE